MRQPISQREARALRRRVRELEQRERALRSAFGSDYPGRHLHTIPLSETSRAIMNTAAALGFVVVGRLRFDGQMALYAVATEVQR